jgi:hypothetical protein
VVNNKLRVDAVIPPFLLMKRKARLPPGFTIAIHIYGTYNLREFCNLIEAFSSNSSFSGVLGK